MKKLKRLILTAAAFMFMILMMPMAVHAESGSWILEKDETEVYQKYGYYEEKNDKAYDHGPTAWKIGGAKAYCANVYRGASVKTAYDTRTSLADFISKIKAGDKYLDSSASAQETAAYAYFGLYELPSGADARLYRTAAQFLVWEEMNVKGKWGLNDKNPDSEDNKKLKEVQDDIKGRASTALKNSVFDANIYTYGKAQEILADITRKAGSAEVKFKKFLTAADGAETPAVTFAFKIEGMEVEDGTIVENRQLHSGNDSTYVTGMPAVGSASFAQGSKDAVEVNVDFTGVSFLVPGTFRYKITENAADVSGIVNDPAAVRILDVYVDNTSSGIIIADYNLYNEGMNTKSEGFTNEYKVDEKKYSLTVKKSVTGNQGSLNEYFPIKISLTNALTGSTFNVTVNGDTNDSVHANPSVLTVGENGTAEGEFWLKHNQSAVIQDISASTGYTVKETDTGSGYVVSFKVEGDEVNTDGSSVIGTEQVEDDILTGDTTVTVINTKDGTVPTGVDLPLWPAVLASVGAAAAILLVLMKKRTV